MCTTQKSGISRGERAVAVDWQDCGWRPLIAVRMPLPLHCRVAMEPPSMPPLLPQPSRHDPEFFKTMKTITMKCDKWPVFAELRPGRQMTSLRQASARQASDNKDGAMRQAHSCRVSRVTRRPHAFTLVELLTVIAIIAILAAMLLPVLSAARKHAQKVQAHLQAVDIATAIEKYDSDYGRFPVSSAAQQAAQTAKNDDYTYGGIYQTPTATWPNPIPGNYQTNNSEVIAILMDYTNFPPPIGGWTVNTNYQKNPQRTIFLNAKMSGWDPSQGGLPEPGVGNDLVYRDPWGNPYVITMDLNYDENCWDAFYKLPVSAGGLNGLIQQTDNNNITVYGYHGKVMVWSAGPDGKIDPGSPASGPNSGANKDNVLSWQ